MCDLLVDTMHYRVKINIYIILIINIYDIITFMTPQVPFWTNDLLKINKKGEGDIQYCLI